MLIAFHAEGRQSGKDTAGKFLAEWATDRGLPYERRAFGDKMKLLVARTLGIEGHTDEETIARVDKFKLNGFVDYVVLPSKKAWSIGRLSGREFIINLAGDSDDTGARGLFGANFWVDQCLPRVTEHQGRVIGVTDLRFDVEADRVHWLGGAVVQICRKASEGGRSEQGITPSKVDYEIDNNRSLDDLHALVWRIAGREWLKQKL